METGQGQCVECQHLFGFHEFVEHILNQGDNRIYCSECQTGNYLVVETKALTYKLLRIFTNFLWLIGFVLGVYIIELSMSKTPYFVISIAHFVMGFLGALLGVFIAKFLKKTIRWKFGTLKIEDKSYDYDM